MTRTLWLLPVLFLACFVPAPQSQAQDVFFRPALKAKDIEPSLHTDWYGVYLKDKKNGYVKTSRERDGDTVEERMVMNMKVVSMMIKSEITFTQSMSYEDKPPHRLLLGRFVQSDGTNAVTITARRLNEKEFEHSVEVAGQKRAKKVQDLDYGLADSLALETWLRSAPRVGDQILGKDLDVKDWQADQTRYKLTAIKTSFVRGVLVRFYEVELTPRKVMITVLQRLDSNGTLLQGTIVGQFEQRKESEADAKNTEFSLDFFVLGQARVDKEIGSTTRIKELVLEIQGKVGSIFEDGPMQSIAVDGDVRLIKTGRKHGHEVKASAKEIADNLAETTTHAISDAKVKAVAREAIGDAQTPEEKVERIVKFVHRYIRGSLTASMPNIHTLLEEKKGDCKSYALLTTNLCRAAGIPSREVSGLVYMGDDAKAFGGHAWNEVVINGVWVPVDSSRGQVEVDAGHLCFGTEQKASKNLLESLGKLSFRVIESK